MRRNRCLSLFGAGVVLLLFASARAAVMFEDNFDAYVDDLTQLGDDIKLTDAGWEQHAENAPVEPCIWTTTNSGGRIYPPMRDGNPTAGIFLISDSDFVGGENPTGSGMSQDIWSPVFSTAGKQKVWLHFACTAQLNNNGRAVFDVDVSLDLGETWENVYRRVAPSRTVSEPVATPTNADGVYGAVDIDISELGADWPELRLRWRHFEPNDDWWIAIDDVVIDDQAPPSGGATTLVAEQGFSGGIPEGWEVRSVVDPVNTGDGTWTTNDIFSGVGRTIVGKTFPIYDGRGVHRLGDEFIICDIEAVQGVKDEYLILPILDCTNCTKVFLHWKSEIVHDGGNVAEVLVSTDGGLSFDATPIFSYNLGGGFDSGEEPFYSENVYEIPGAATQNALTFAFHYAGASNRYWALDDIKVSAEGNFVDPGTCENRDPKAAFDPATAKVTGTFKNFAGDSGFRIFDGARKIGADLPGTATGFTDDAPTPGGVISYKLQVLKGGDVNRECDIQPLTVFVCPTALAISVDQVQKRSILTWTAGVNLAASIEVRRNGATVATLPGSASTYTDASGVGTWDYEVVVVPSAGANPAQCATVLRARAFIPGDNIYFDDFEAYATDDDLEAAGWVRKDEGTPVENAIWTITNPGGRANPPTQDGVASNGKFMISDSDWADGDNPTCSGMSHDLWSPNLDCTGRSKVWLHMHVSAQMNNNGVVVFDVDVSTDDGLAWTNAYRTVAPARTGCEPMVSVENADGFFGQLDLDLTPLAANKADVRVRLRQFEPNDDWWVAMDNFLVDENSLGGRDTILPVESFTDGIPGTWTTSSNAAGATPWNTDDTCQVSLLNFSEAQGLPVAFPDGADGRRLHRLDAKFALADPFCSATVQDEFLSTPTVNCKDFLEVFLHVKSEMVPLTTAVAEILLSLDGGTTYLSRPVFSYAGGGLFDENEDPFFGDHILRVPAAAGQERVVFAFHYKSPAGGGTWWGIDDVSVSGNKAKAPVNWIRGEFNGDGGLDISDAVGSLNYQFTGGAAPKCESALDFNKDGAADVSDPVGLLGYLFLGVAGPPAPFPGCEDLAGCPQAACQ